MTIKSFQNTILAWYKIHKRDHLPWRPQRKQRSFDPYNLLVSEVMLQQTQVSRVLQKYPVFLKTFPTIQSLANASLSEVLGAWQGMGYNRRAKFLRLSAKEIVERYKGRIPQEMKKLLSLPGIGHYTAGAIAAFAYNKPVVFMDTNIRKVFIHFFFANKEKVSDKEVRAIALKALDKENPRDWHYALMDYGALELASAHLLLQKAKAYKKQSLFIGSSRYFRAQIIKYLLAHRSGTKKEIVNFLKENTFYTTAIAAEKILYDLKKEDLVVKQKGRYMIA